MREHALKLFLTTAIVVVFAASNSAKMIQAQNEQQDNAASQPADSETASFDPIRNAGFEAGQPGDVPTGWYFPKSHLEFSASTTTQNAKEGKQCAMIECDKRPTAPFSSLSHSTDAVPFRGKRVRFRAAVRTEGEDCDAQLWFRVDCTNSPGTFDNMRDRPIKSDQWSYYAIVGDVADDARGIMVGLIMHGQGKIFMDDVSLEVVADDVKPTATLRRKRPAIARANPARRRGTPINQLGPGLFEVLGSMEVRSTKSAFGAWKALQRPAANGEAKDLAGKEEQDVAEARLLLPIPLSYRDQVPLSYELTADPPTALKSVLVYEDRTNNYVAEVVLTDISKHKKVDLKFRAAVLVAPSSFDDAPKTAPIPDKWPLEAKPWLQSTWCVESDNERIQEIAKSIRTESDDVMEIISNVEKKAKSIIRSAEGRVNNLTAVEALDKRGSCTSCGNLVAALLRATDVPARVLSGYPSWSGPLQTHYIVEAYVPNYGWYPVESTMCRSPWPNSHQVNVAIIPPEYETKQLAGRRPTGAGGVPYLSLTEAPDNKNRRFFSMGTIEGAPGCDHECQLIRKFEGEKEEWAKAISWAKPRWAEWVKSEQAAEEGRFQFSITADQIDAESPSALVIELGK